MKLPKLMEEMEKLGFKPQWNNSKSLQYDCPKCGAEKKFIYYPTEKGGNFWCAKCPVSGNLYGFLTKICDYASFHAEADAAEAYDPEFSLQEIMHNFLPLQKYNVDNHKYWNTNAIRFHKHTLTEMEKNSVARNWLKEHWGLKKKTIKKARLGYNPTAEPINDIDHWGLERGPGYSRGSDRFWLPEGLVIPKYNTKKYVFRLRFKILNKSRIGVSVFLQDRKIFRFDSETENQKT